MAPRWKGKPPQCALVRASTNDPFRSSPMENAASEFTYAARDVQPFEFVMGLFFTFLFFILYLKLLSRNVVVDVVVVLW